MSRARHKRILKRRHQAEKRLRQAGLFFSWLIEQNPQGYGLMTFPASGGYTIEWAQPRNKWMLKKHWHRRHSDTDRKIDFPWSDHQIVVEGDSPNQTLDPDMDGVVFRELLP